MIEPKQSSACAESFVASALEAAHMFGEVVLQVDASQQSVEVSMINTTKMKETEEPNFTTIVPNISHRYTNRRPPDLVRDAYLIEHACENSDQRFFYRAMLDSPVAAAIRSEMMEKLNSKWRIQYDPLSFDVFVRLTSGKK